MIIAVPLPVIVATAVPGGPAARISQQPLNFARAGCGTTFAFRESQEDRDVAGIDKVARAHLEREDGFRFSVTFPELERAAAMTVDETVPLGGGAGPNPAALLAASVGSCLAASLVFCLRKARVEPSDVTADVVARIVRNEAGRFRIGGIEVELSLAVAEDDRAGLERCTPLFEDFCIVTESVRHGVPVQVRLTTNASVSCAGAVGLEHQ